MALTVRYISVFRVATSGEVGAARHQLFSKQLVSGAHNGTIGCGNRLTSCPRFGTGGTAPLKWVADHFQPQQTNGRFPCS